MCEPSVSQAASAERRTVRQVDQFHKAVDNNADNAESTFDSKDINKSSETEAQARKADVEHEKNVRHAEAYWSEKAKAKDWDCITADASVYRFSGTKIEGDPRRTPKYREQGTKAQPPLRLKVCGPQLAFNSAWT